VWLLAIVVRIIYVGIASLWFQVEYPEFHGVIQGIRVVYQDFQAAAQEFQAVFKDFQAACHDFWKAVVEKLGHSYRWLPP
jgi:hypothetical protein